MARALIVSVAASIAAATGLDASLELALTQDDQCGEGPASCALQALQVKVKATPSEVDEETDAEDDNIAKGIVGDLRKSHKACFATCPELHRSLEDVISVYLEEDKGKAGAMGMVCLDQKKFHCPMTRGKKECTKLFEEAKGLDLDIPDTTDALESKCDGQESEGAFERDATDDAEETETDDNASFLQREVNACKTDVVGDLYEDHGECFDVCPHACAPLQHAINVYMQDGQPDAENVVCSQAAKFGCFIRTPQCQGLLKMAKNMGVEIPEDQANLVPAFRKRCPGHSILQVVSVAQPQEESSLKAILAQVRDVVSKPTTEDPCTTGMVGELRKTWSDCIDSCPMTCTSLEVAFKVFMVGGAAKAQDWICEKESVWDCAFEEGNRKKCDGIIQEAQDLGIAPPSNGKEDASLAERCDLLKVRRPLGQS